MQTPGTLTPAEEKEAMLGVDSNRGFFSLFGNYQNPLQRLRWGSEPNTSQPQRPSPVNGTLPPKQIGAITQNILTQEALHVGAIPSPSQATVSAFAAVRAVSERRYRLSTLIAFMLIAFLIGSLLRSLLSPADFIYVVNDLSEVTGEVGTVEPGWREIKRLVEVKYIVGGWDFQIAVVRRH